MDSTEKSTKEDLKSDLTPIEIETLFIVNSGLVFKVSTFLKVLGVGLEPKEHITDLELWYLNY